MCSDSRMVEYLDKKSIWTQFTLREALEHEDDEMNRRLRYTKDLVGNIIAKSTGVPVEREAKPVRIKTVNHNAKINLKKDKEKNKERPSYVEQISDV